MGETGIRLVLRALPIEGERRQAAQLIAANAEDERRELMWEALERCSPPLPCTT